MNWRLLLSMPALLSSAVCAAAPATGPVNVNVVNEPLQVQDVNQPTEEYYQQSVSITWNSWEGADIAKEFPVYGGSPGAGDEGLPADTVLVLDHVGLRISDMNSPPIGGIHCTLLVPGGNSGNNLNSSELPIVTTPVPNYDSSGFGPRAVYVASQNIVQYHYFPGMRPALRCVARETPASSILVKADIVGRLRSTAQ